MQQELTGMFNEKWLLNILDEYYKSYWLSISGCNRVKVYQHLTLINEFQLKQNDIRHTVLIGEYLCAGSTKNVHIRNVITGKKLDPLSVNIRVMIKHLNYLAIGDDQGFISVWNIHTQRMVSRYKQNTSVYSLISLKDKLISKDNDTVRIWDTCYFVKPRKTLIDNRENIVPLLNLENTITLLDLDKYYPYSLFHTKNFIVASKYYIYSLDGVLVNTVPDEHGYGYQHYLDNTDIIISRNYCNNNIKIFNIANGDNITEERDDVVFVAGIIYTIKNGSLYDELGGLCLSSPEDNLWFRFNIQKIHDCYFIRKRLHTEIWEHGMLIHTIPHQIQDSFKFLQI